MKTTGSLALALTLALVTAALAGEAAPPAGDVVHLRNGDRLSGTIVKMDGETLFITTPYAKEVAVDWKEVVGLETADPHWVRLATDEFVKGRFVSAPEGVSIESEDLQSPEPVALDRIATIGIPPGAKYSGSIGALASGSTGNTETLVLGAAGGIQRDTDDDRARLGFRSEYEEQDNELTEQRTRGYADYDYYLGKKWYLTSLVRLEHDKFEDLSLRTIVGGGPGYRFFDRKDLKLRAYAGLAYVNENFNEADDRDFLSALVGDDFLWKITDSLSVYQLAEIYPSLDDVSDTLFHAEVGVRQTLGKGIFVDFGVVNDYDTKPAEGKEKNDFRYVGQVGYGF